MNEEEGLDENGTGRPSEMGGRMADDEWIAYRSGRLDLIDFS